MTRQLYYAIFKVDTGWMGVAGTAEGLRHIVFPQSSAREVQSLLGDGFNSAIRSPKLFHNLTERLRAYFRGDRTDFPVKIDLSGAIDFQRAVWEKARAIPYGETRSYGWLAEQIRRPGAARAVGQALGRNPLPIIIPCHRVLAADGTLGGFSGGIGMKIWLLRLEAEHMCIT